MNRWKLVSCAEAIVLIILLLPGGQQQIQGEESYSDSRSSLSIDAAVARERRVSGSPDGVVNTASRDDAPRLRPWSGVPELITIIGEVNGEGGEPVLRSSIIVRGADDASERIMTSQKSNVFLLNDRPAGPLQLEVSASGYETWQGTIVLEDVPRLQRCSIRLKRMWRIPIWVRTPDGSLFRDALRERLGTRADGMRISAAALPEAAVSDRRAKDRIPSRTEIARWVWLSPQDRTLPAGCSGALDVHGSPPFVISVWLDRFLLGNVEIRDGMTDAVLIASTDDFLRRLGRVQLRVVDAQSGQPLAGARVELSPAWGGGGPSAITGEDGKATLTEVPLENLDLDVSLAGYAEAYRELQVDPSANLDLGDVPLHLRGKLIVRVLTPGGIPWAEQGFRFFPCEGWLRPEEPRRYSVRTDTDGRAEANASEAGYQAIFGGRDGFGLQAYVWSRGSAESDMRTIQLQPGVEVVVTAHHANGEARVAWILDSESRLLSSSWLTREQPAKWTLTPGSYLLRIEDLDRNYLTTQELRVPDGGGEIAVELP